MFSFAQKNTLPWFHCFICHVDTFEIWFAKIITYVEHFGGINENTLPWLASYKNFEGTKLKYSFLVSFLQERFSRDKTARDIVSLTVSIRFSLFVRWKDSSIKKWTKRKPCSRRRKEKQRDGFIETCTTKIPSFSRNSMFSWLPLWRVWHSEWHWVWLYVEKLAILSATHSTASNVTH